MEKLDGLFSRPVPGQTINCSLKLINLDSYGEIMYSNIFVERGEVVFYSEKGEIRYGPGVRPGLPGNGRCRPSPGKTMKEFSVSPATNVSVLAHKSGVAILGVGNGRLVENDDWDPEYFKQALPIQSSGKNWIEVELRVVFSKDFSGRLGGWKVIKTP
ncbi:MAG: hypothetical protein ABFD92_19280 [Planctomycetaceae bacterium]